MSGIQSSSNFLKWTPVLISHNHLRLVNTAMLGKQSAHCRRSYTRSVFPNFGTSASSPCQNGSETEHWESVITKVVKSSFEFSDRQSPLGLNWRRSSAYLLRSTSCPGSISIIIHSFRYLLSTASSCESHITSVLSERPFKSADKKTERGKVSTRRRSEVKY